MLERTRFYCHACHAALDLERPPGRRDECAKCGAELHACRNCTFHDPRMSQGCREPQADEVRDPERANFCGYFLFKEGRPEGAGSGGPQAAKQAFEALFGKAAAKKDEPQDAQKAAFDKLFKR